MGNPLDCGRPNNGSVLRLNGLAEPNLLPLRVLNRIPTAKALFNGFVFADGASTAFGLFRNLPRREKVGQAKVPVPLRNLVTIGLTINAGLGGDRV